jgi:hypothetical protein
MKSTIENDLEWWIAYTPSTGVVHYGEATKGQVIETGQQYLNTFTDYQLYLERLIELGINPETPEND